MLFKKQLEFLGFLLESISFFIQEASVRGEAKHFQGKKKAQLLFENHSWDNHDMDDWESPYIFNWSPILSSQPNWLHSFQQYSLISCYHTVIVIDLSSQNPIVSLMSYLSFIFWHIIFYYCLCNLILYCYCKFCDHINLYSIWNKIIIILWQRICSGYAIWTSSRDICGSRTQVTIFWLPYKSLSLIIIKYVRVSFRMVKKCTKMASTKRRKI